MLPEKMQRKLYGMHYTEGYSISGMAAALFVSCRKVHRTFNRHEPGIHCASRGLRRRETKSALML
ncbi:hypothetical protein RA27_22150 [Ruegeria sp. ANG-R]|nr:hypothetical protein RA27_22150 [Ruegeria sp. ANG-R]